MKRKARIKIIYANENGKLEFSKEELETLLDEVYEQGFEDGKSQNIIWSPGNPSPEPKKGWWEEGPYWTYSETVTKIEGEPNPNVKIIG